MKNKHTIIFLILSVLCICQPTEIRGDEQQDDIRGGMYMFFGAMGLIVCAVGVAHILKCLRLECLRSQAAQATQSNIPQNNVTNAARINSDPGTSLETSLSENEV